MNSAVDDRTWMVDAVACLLLCGIIIWLYFPGLMTNDSIIQLAQAQRHVYEDTHPPVMSFLWQGLNHFYFGPACMLVFHAAMFFLGLFLLIRAQAWSVYARLSAVILVTFWPAVFTQLGMIWKDVGLSASFLLGCGLLANRRRYPFMTYVAIVPFFYGICVRHNAWPAALPLLFIVVWDWTGPPPNRMKATAGAMLLCGIILGVQELLTSHLIRQKEHFGQVVLLHDLVAISAWTGTSVIPVQFLQPGIGVRELRDVYRPGNAEPLRPVIILTRDKKSLSELERVWAVEILRHPKIYLRHRWIGFERLAGLAHEDVHYPFERETSPNPWNFRYDPGPLMKMIFQWLERWHNAFFFRGWFYLAVNGAALLLAGVRHKNRFSFCVSLSGLLYGGGIGVYGLSLDFRFFYWTALAGFIAWILLFDPLENGREMGISSSKV